MPRKGLSFEKMILRPFNAIRQKRKGYQQLNEQAPPIPPRRPKQRGSGRRRYQVKKRNTTIKKKLTKKKRKMPVARWNKL